MMNIRKYLSVLSVFAIMIMAGCGEQEEDAVNQDNDPVSEEGDLGTESDLEEVSNEEGLDLELLELQPFAEEIGLSLTSPEYREFSTDTTVLLEGSVDDSSGLNSDALWVLINYTEPGEKPFRNNFNYYVPIEEDGSFKKEISLHSGEGAYRVTVRAPSNKQGEDNRFYDVAQIYPTNTSDELAREIEYTEVGLDNELEIVEPLTGYEEAEGSVPLAGYLPDAEDDHYVMVEIKKTASERRDTVIPIQDGYFESEIPLHFGGGLHEIIVKVYNPENERYYDSANFFVDNRTDKQFVHIEEYREYFERGITLTHPTPVESFDYNGDTYRLAGEIDPDAPGADEITHMIVKTEYENEEATYYLPVEDYRFDEEIWFRFGEGEYKITVNVPELGHEGGGFFRFNGVVHLTHHVHDVEDQRSLLPSRGIQSDHVDIQKLAEELTDGLSDEREKAKAVYQYVAENISYDVKKFREDLFELDDSALKTLEEQKGVCQDYAFLAVALLRSIDMEAHYVSGYAGGRHAWVEVKVDDDWLEMDPTWGSGYVDGEEFVFHYNEDYFDPEPDFFEETHQRIEVMY